MANQENARVRCVTKSYVICYTRPFLRSSSSCEQLLYSRLVELFSHHLPSHLPAECISIRLFVFNLLLLSVWRIFYPYLFIRFSIKPSQLWPFIPNGCLSFVVLLFSSANECKALGSSGYILTAATASQ